jgi:hypothetical protein
MKNNDWTHDSDGRIRRAMVRVLPNFDEAYVDGMTPYEIWDLLIEGKFLEEWDVSEIIWPYRPDLAYPND